MIWNPNNSQLLWQELQESIVSIIMYIDCYVLTSLKLKNLKKKIHCQHWRECTLDCVDTHKDRDIQIQLSLMFELVGVLAYLSKGVVDEWILFTTQLTHISVLAHSQAWPHQWRPSFQCMRVCISVCYVVNVYKNEWDKHVFCLWAFVDNKQLK